MVDINYAVGYYAHTIHWGRVRLGLWVLLPGVPGLKGLGLITSAKPDLLRHS